jgi:hypothetical protein
MSKLADLRRKHYAEDPEYRERQKAGARAYYQANKKTITSGKRHRWATDPEYRSRLLAIGRKRRRRYRLKYKYGLSLHEYDAMSRRQKGACAICKARGKLCVDHCHTTRVVGGLLCHNCNRGLGFFGDSPATMLSGATYLLQTRPQALSGAELARTRRALRRFIKVLDEVAAARRRRKGAAGRQRAGLPVLRVGPRRRRAYTRSSPPSPPARSRADARRSATTHSHEPTASTAPFKIRTCVPSKRRRTKPSNRSL